MLHNRREVKELTFGERLRGLREDSDLTQKALASVINVSPRMVSFYESGKHFPRDETILIKLAEHFGVTTDFLLGRSNIKNFEILGQMAKLYEVLPEQERKALSQYIEFLAEKAQKSSKKF